MRFTLEEKNLFIGAQILSFKSRPGENETGSIALKNSLKELPEPFQDCIPILGYYANTADSVQTMQNATSDHCLKEFLYKIE